MTEPGFARIPRTSSLRDSALTQLRQAVVSGKVLPGQVVSASSLAREMGVSVSPVREAALVLVDEGMLEPVRNKGFRVVPLTDKDRREVYQLRLLLEVPATVALADVDLSSYVETLEAHVQATEEAALANDVEALLAHDRDFHLALLSIGGNQRLVDLVASLRDQTRLYGLSVLASRGTLVENTAAEHRKILEALLRGDRNGVERIVTKHLTHLMSDWADE